MTSCHAATSTPMTCTSTWPRWPTTCMRCYAPLPRRPPRHLLSEPGTAWQATTDRNDAGYGCGLPAKRQNPDSRWQMPPATRTLRHKCAIQESLGRWWGEIWVSQAIWRFHVRIWGYGYSLPFEYISGVAPLFLRSGGAIGYRFRL